MNFSMVLQTEILSTVTSVFFFCLKQMIILKSFNSVFIFIFVSIKTVMINLIQALKLNQ